MKMHEVAQCFIGISANRDSCATDERFRLASDSKLQYNKFKAQIPLDAKWQVHYGAIVMCFKSDPM